MQRGGRTQTLRRPRVPVEGLFCNYTHRECLQNRIEGYEYCMKHILEDKHAPYKQCNFISNRNGKRCMNAASKSDKKEGYCTVHAWKAASARQRAGRRRRPRETPETLLEEIEHYATKPPGNGQQGEPRRGRAGGDNTATRILDYASSSDTDDDSGVVDQAWRGDGDSDAESVDSEQEDPLKHAGVYTAEEVALITRDKLIRLQSLYIDQFKRLQHVMREKRRKYLATVRRERETLGSIHAAKEDPEQREKYEKLVAMNRYHKRYGTEALLHRASKERRIAMSEGPNYRPPGYPRCIYLHDGVKCGCRTVPLSKFCLKHIMQDPHQVLFQPCNYGLGACLQPTPPLPAEQARCPWHSELSRTVPSRLPQPQETAMQVDMVSESDPQTMGAPTCTVTATTSTTLHAGTTATSSMGMQITQEANGSIKQEPQQTTWLAAGSVAEDKT